MSQGSLNPADMVANILCETVNVAIDVFLIKVALEKADDQYRSHLQDALQTKQEFLDKMASDVVNPPFVDEKSSPGDKEFGKFLQEATMFVAEYFAQFSEKREIQRFSEICEGLFDGEETNDE